MPRIVLPMKKAIGDNMIPRDWTLERGLELVKRAGYDGIELWLGDRPWFTMETTDARIGRSMNTCEVTVILASVAREETCQ